MRYYHRVLGLAFRALLVAAPSELTPEANGAQLAMGLGSAGYRTFVDPLMVTPQVCCSKLNDDLFFLALHLAMGLGSAGYRTFVDPLMVTPQVSFFLFLYSAVVFTLGIQLKVREGYVALEATTIADFTFPTALSRSPLCLASTSLSLPPWWATLS